MMHLRLHVRYNVSRNSTFSVACNRIAVGESIVTGDLLSLELASESSSNTKNKIPPAIPVENEKSLHRHHPKFASGIDSCGKGSREHNFRNAFAMRLLGVCIFHRKILVIYRNESSRHKYSMP